MRRIFHPSHITLSEHYASTLIYYDSPDRPEDLTPEQLARCKARLHAVYKKLLALESLIETNPTKYARICPIECSKACDELRRVYRTLTRQDRRI